MIRFKLAEAMAEFAFRQGRRIEWKEVSEATGIHRSTLSKFLNVRGYNATTDNLDRLCSYFGCEIQDLMAYVQDSEKTAR